MLRLQIWILTTYLLSGASARRRGTGDAGEITSTVAIIGVLVVGAIAAGAIVVSKMTDHANAIPNPGG